MELEKSFLEKRIEERADQRVRQEYDELYLYLRRNPLTKSLEIGGLGLVTEVSLLLEYVREAATRENSNIKDVLIERKKELIKEESDKLIQKLQGIEYLFNQM